MTPVVIYFPDRPYCLQDGHILWGYIPYQAFRRQKLVMEYHAVIAGFAMGCVKDDDAIITWDHKAMQEGRPWGVQ